MFFFISNFICQGKSSTPSHQKGDSWGGLSIWLGCLLVLVELLGSCPTGRMPWGRLRTCKKERRDQSKGKSCFSVVLLTHRVKLVCCRESLQLLLFFNISLKVPLQLPDVKCCSFGLLSQAIPFCPLYYFDFSCQFIYSSAHFMYG